MTSNSNKDAMPYNLYYCNNHLLAQNIDGHLVDIGTTETEDGQLSYQLDGNQEQGTGFDSPEALLADVETKISFLFLDGQFTSLPDVSADYRDTLDDAPSREIQLHELNDEDEEALR